MEHLDEGVVINVGNVLIALNVTTSMGYVNLDVHLDSLASLVKTVKSSQALNLLVCTIFLIESKMFKNGCVHI